MKKEIFYMLSGAIAFTFTAAMASSAHAKPASAEDRFLSTGWHPYIGGNYVYNKVDMDYSADFVRRLPGASSNLTSTPTISKDGNLSQGSVVFGLGRMTNSNFYYGIEGEAYIGKKLQLNQNLQNFNGTTSDVIGQFSIKPVFDIGLRFGYAVGQYVMPYIKVGISSYNIMSSPYQEVLDGNASAFGLSDNRGREFANNMKSEGNKAGYYLGAGLEFKLSQNLFLRGEYNYSQVQSNKATYHINVNGDLLDASNSHSSYDIHKVKVGFVITM